ncbi:unnamed protein product [Prorocentrum cordatum]|uniref:Uncharacterized protein n=1 Tax=Prorocentrum cordatum TaxID=2364126 RepID=A0ABN9VKQ6_9DINO|nr:unnamed protein product [Polarella glacialis]
MPAPVDIVELGLGHAIVNVDGWEQELALRSHLLQPVDASGGLLADALALRGHARVLCLVGRDGISQQLQDALEFGVVRAGRIGQGSVLRELFLELLALVDQQRRVAAVIDELVAAVRAWHCHHLLGTPPYSCRVSPFHANTVDVSAFAMAAAAWSCVLKMLQEHQRTLAPSACKVSMRTPVWIVMCRDPLMFIPLKGCFGPNSLRAAMRPGISCSARLSSLRPNSARPMSLTLDSAMTSQPGVTRGES